MNSSENVNTWFSSVNYSRTYQFPVVAAGGLGMAADGAGAMHAAAATFSEISFGT